MAAADRRFSWHEASTGGELGPAPVEAADEGPSAASRLADLLRADATPGTVLSRTA
jgi:hypothetical protein